MERADNVAVVPVEMGWNDVGTWEALQEIFPQGRAGKCPPGPGADRDSKGCTFYAQNRLVATIGLERSSWWIPRTPPWCATGTGSRK